MPYVLQPDGTYKWVNEDGSTMPTGTVRVTQGKDAMGSPSITQTTNPDLSTERGSFDGGITPATEQAMADMRDANKAEARAAIDASIQAGLDVGFDGNDYVSGMSVAELKNLVQFGPNLATSEERAAARDAAKLRLLELAPTTPRTGNGMSRDDLGGTWDGTYSDGSSIYDLYGGTGGNPTTGAPTNNGGAPGTYLSNMTNDELQAYIDQYTAAQQGPDINPSGMVYQASAPSQPTGSDLTMQRPDYGQVTQNAPYQFQQQSSQPMSIRQAQVQNMHNVANSTQWKDDIRGLLDMPGFNIQGLL